MFHISSLAHGIKMFILKAFESLLVTSYVPMLYIDHVRNVKHPIFNDISTLNHFFFFIMPKYR